MPSEKSFRVANLANGSSPDNAKPIEFGGRKYILESFGYTNPADVISRLNSLPDPQRQAFFVAECVRREFAAKIEVKNVMTASDFIEQARKRLDETLSDQVKVFRSK